MLPGGSSRHIEQARSLGYEVEVVEHEDGPNDGCMFSATLAIESEHAISKIYDQSKEIEELQLAGWKYRALRATLPANNANVIWLERNVWAGNKDGIRQCQQFVINYEDSVRRRYEMEQQVAKKDSTAKRLMMESDKIKKMLE